MDKTKKTAREYRYDLITLIYQSELLDKEFSASEIFEEEDSLTDFQIKEVEVIQNKYQFLKEMIKFYLSESWTWERMNALLRAILLYGAAQLIYANPKIVINEMIEITRDYNFQEKQTKFVNGILDKVAKNIAYLKNKKDEK